MRMVESSLQQLPSVGAYRVQNDHAPNVVVENVPEKGGTDEDDDDAELLADGEMNSRLGLCRSNNGEVTTGPHSRMENDKRLRREIANSNERRRMQSINAGFQSLKALLPRRDGEKMSKASILQQTADFIRSLQTERDVLLQQSNDLKQLLDVGTLKSNRQPIEKVLAPSCIPKTEALPIEKRSCGEYGITSMDMSMAPPKKRRKFDNDSADEGVGMLSDAEAMTIPRNSPGHGVSPPITTVMAFTQTDQPCATAEVSCCTSPFSPHLNEPKSVESSMVQDKLWEIEMLQRQLIELRLALDRERRVRLMLEDQMRITELNRLQTLARLQTVPLVEYNLPQTPANSAVVYPCAVSSPMPIVRAMSPSLLRPLSATSVNNSAANHCATVTTASPTPMASTIAAVPAPPVSLHSLPDPISRLVPPVSQPPKVDTQPLPSAPVNNIGGINRAALSVSPSECISKQSGQPNPANNPALYPSNSSKQSLAAIVEAIRHLEGDQLFVDVELQRPSAQQQSVAVSAVVSSTTGGPSVVTSHCQSVVIGAAARPDYTDSGISSPVSERHLGQSTVSNLASMAAQNIGQLVVTGQNEGNELNHVVAATAAALHNLCFPYTNPQHLVAASRHNQQLQQQVRQRAAGWSSTSLQ